MERLCMADTAGISSWKERGRPAAIPSSPSQLLPHAQAGEDLGATAGQHRPPHPPPRPAGARDPWQPCRAGQGKHLTSQETGLGCLAEPFREAQNASLKTCTLPSLPPPPRYSAESTGLRRAAKPRQYAEEPQLLQRVSARKGPGMSYAGAQRQRWVGKGPRLKGDKGRKTWRVFIRALMCPLLSGPCPHLARALHGI